MRRACASAAFRSRPNASNRRSRSSGLSRRRRTALQIIGARLTAEFSAKQVRRQGPAAAQARSHGEGWRVLKIWGRANSFNVQKVLWCADELGVPYERVDLGGPFGGNDDPAYRRLNPNGVVPTIQDGDLVLWESNAIVRYLAAKHGSGTLYPSDLAVRADADRWMDWQLTTIQEGM